jgi:hypothetical protein
VRESLREGYESCEMTIFAEQRRDVRFRVAEKPPTMGGAGRAEPMRVQYPAPVAFESLRSFRSGSFLGPQRQSGAADLPE